MKRAMWMLSVASVLLCGGVLAAAEEEAIEPKEKIALFDGKSFDGWVRYLRGGKGDPDKTWAIKEGGAIACTGRPAGYIRTEKAYKNYHLRLEYRWPGRTGNNGVLAHMVGKDNVWPKSLECQGQFHAQGDFWEIGGWKFNEHTTGGHRVRGRNVHKYDPHNEKEPGEWNVYEVWAVGDVVRPYVNGKLMNEASGCQITAGKICLQSEGAPIEYRNITLEPPTGKPWPVTPTKKTELFNGKDLTGWVRFIPNEKKVDGTWQTQTVWTVKDGVIHCTGKPNGYIRTEESYANYKLHVEWRWAAKPTNSGVLLHKQGIDKVWPTCVEAQLMHQNAGDFWLLSHSTIKAGGQQIGPKPYANAKKRGEPAEKPAGEWNTYDITCDGGTVKLVVNGRLMNEGTDANPSSGTICLQSEGSPIEFRNVYLEPLGK
ncbi:MAG: DUF1080 domain-containing protein [Candidatus Brocadiae bacterium]|nr:DUF1080 domain-containing protein [Candidatus Brocadiia bacterium]